MLPAFGTYFLNFNCREKLHDGRDDPLSPTSASATGLAMAVDRQSITAQVRRLGEPALPTLIPPGSIAVELTRARDRHRGRPQLLADAGYPGARGLPSIDYLFTRDSRHVIAQAVAEQ